MATPEILLLGASGQLGREIQRVAPADAALRPFTSADLDISDREAVRACLRRLRPDVIINAAAYTQVDKAESELGPAFAVNARGVENLGREAAEATRIVHISTDFVFDGEKNAPYEPDDHPHPLSVYGKSKQLGEQSLRELKPRTSVILRTAWLYSAAGANFVNTMLRLMGEKERQEKGLSVVADQQGTPTSAETLAQVIWAMAARPEASGIFHWTDRGQTTWYDFAVEIQRRALDLGLLKQTIPIAPIPTEQYPTPARRPRYSVLDTSATRELTGITGIPWQEALQKTLLRIQSL